jgi:hypothetical protein
MSFLDRPPASTAHVETVDRHDHDLGIRLPWHAGASMSVHSYRRKGGSIRQDRKAVGAPLHGLLVDMYLE